MNIYIATYRNKINGKDVAVNFMRSKNTPPVFISIW